MLLLLLSCTSEKTAVPDVLSLSETLSETEVRAGEVISSDALFGGTSAEGQIGDFKIYNNKVQFIIQSDRPSNYYVSQGGGVLDADVVRPDGEYGRDVIDEHTPMAGFGLILDPTSVEVLNDGADGTATIRVIGTGTGFELLEGAVENTALIPDKSMQFQVDYSLAPNSSMLEVKTKVIWNDETSSFQPANVILVGREVLDIWNPGGGYFGDSTTEWYGAIGKRNEVAFGIFPSGDNFTPSVIQPLLEDATPALSGFEAMIEVSTGMEIEYTQYIGVGSDFAQLTDEWYALRGVDTQTVDGVVTDGTVPVKGARVNVMNDDAVITLAVTDENGAWSASVPSDLDVQYRVTGRGHNEIYDVPAGSAWFSLYAEQAVMEADLSSFSNSNLEGYHAEGYGVAEPGTDTLTAPGFVEVNVADGGPAVVHVDFAGEGTDTDFSQVPGRPGGHVSMGYVRDGDLTLPLEPGEYLVTVHRGTTCEYAQATVTVASGTTESINAELDCLTLPDGIVSADPHSHSSPSGDGRIGTVERILTFAAHGVDIHISTEHDHVADYAPLVSALGLDGHLEAMVGAEVSPTLRGHHNAFPLNVNENEINKGAVSWWTSWTTTADLHQQIRDAMPEFGVLQVNHPLGSGGLLGSAGINIEQGTYSKANFWSDNFDVMELNNDGSYDEYMPYYFDLVSRGYGTGPTSVSDSHCHTCGVGANRTFVYAEGDTLADVAEGVYRGRTVPSAGPYIHVTIDGEFAPGSTVVGPQDIDVEVYNPSWMDIDTLELYENGVVVDTVPYESGSHTFSVNPNADAHYAVVASGTFPMVPVYEESPWAMSAVLYIDADGDGWEPLLPPYVEQ